MIILIDSRHGSVSFQYDKRGTLIASHLPSGEIEWRMPDAIGNLFKTEDASDRVYGASGQLLRDKGPDGWTTYDYDAEGNLKKKTEATGRVWLYEWNAAGFLKKVLRPDKKEVAFTYDPFGRRVTKSFEGKKTCWLWDGNVMLHEWVENVSEVERDKVIQLPKQSGAKSAAQKRLQEQLLATSPAHGPPIVEKEKIITWVYEPESFVPMAKLVGEESYSILTDQVGAPIEMLNQRGESVWSSARIDGYGRMQELEGVRDACPFRWQGQYLDVETNLSYNRYRYLDSESGQYISQDPIGLAGGFGLYSYVNVTVYAIDPMGLVEQSRDSSGKFKSKNPGENSPGSEYAEKVKSDYDADPRYKVLGEEVSFKDADSGQIRRYDIVVKDVDTKEVIGVEVKNSPTASYGKAQKTFDNNLNGGKSRISPTGQKAKDHGIDKIDRMEVKRCK